MPLLQRSVLPQIDEYGRSAHLFEIKRYLWQKNLALGLSCDLLLRISGLCVGSEYDSTDRLP
jgi:hypothetical protein